MHHIPSAIRFFSVFKWSAALASSIFLLGCATTSSDKLTTATADYFSAKESEIKITNIKPFGEGISTTYKATYKGVLYNCINGWGSSVDCSRPGGSPFGR
jgi:hypothetical protein